MTARPSRQLEAQVASALRAARKAGLPVLRTEIGADGRIVLVHEGPAAPPVDPAQDWLARYEGSRARN